ncbi:MAG: transaldolase, partial [Bacteroidetes bacterium]|nr:transaldolase [Bacteroidota bacterium]
MTKSFIHEDIRTYILKSVNEEKIESAGDIFWKNLNNAGTEIWLDTGDMELASGLWTKEMSALTTNNTLLNKEIQKGIYDNLIPGLRELVKDFSPDEQVIEIAFILNAYHGLRLVKKFGGLVSVELHTDTADDIDAIVEFGKRYYDICPDHFLVKVPFTATGLLGARKLGEAGVRVNFTLEFSARFNVLVSLIARSSYCNVFMGRIAAYMIDNELGDGKWVGEKAVISSQRWINKLAAEDQVKTKLIVASLREAEQLKSLAGVNVYTIPPAVAKDGRNTLDGLFDSQVNTDYKAEFNNDSKKEFRLDTIWEVKDKELKFARYMDKNVPATGEELTTLARNMGCGDIFPEFTQDELKWITEDGKIPKHSRWADRIAKGELAVDTLLSLAGLATFALDQEKLDQRIKSL